MITTENKVLLRVPAEQVRRRMGSSKLAQFHAHLVHGWLEIDERVPFAGEVLE